MSPLRLVGFDVDLIRRRTGLVLIGAAIAAPSALIALGFAARAAEIALTARLSPEIAALVVAGMAALIATVAVVAVLLVIRRTKREVTRAVATSAVVAVAPTATSLALRHTRLAAVATAAGIGWWLAHRAR